MNCTYCTGICIGTGTDQGNERCINLSHFLAIEFSFYNIRFVVVCAVAVYECASGVLDEKRAKN